MNAVKRVIAILLVTVTLASTPKVSRADDAAPNWVMNFCNGAARMMYGLAWPTATYRTWEFRGITGNGGAIDLVIRLYGISAWDDSLLWTDAIIVIKDDQIVDLQFGDNNGTFAPGSTVTELGQAFVNELRHEQNDINAQR
jgi:hypothetical protein